MSAYGFGDIVLVPFPFTDQSGAKKRPAVIVSSTAYNQVRRDLVIMAVTSQVKPSGTFGEVIIEDWQVAGLLKPSAIKPVFATIEQTLILKRLGQLSTRDQSALRNAIPDAAARSPTRSADSPSVIGGASIYGRKMRDHANAVSRRTPSSGMPFFTTANLKERLMRMEKQ